jgi:hypothetical protein
MPEPGRSVDARLDSARPNFVFATGSKGSGKSELLGFLWRGYPYDRLVIDPTGDVEPGPDVITLEDWGTSWPTRLTPADESGRPQRLSLRVVPDMGSPTYVDDIDRAVAMAFFRHDGPRLCWVDEIGELTSAHSTPPNFRRMLHQGRHRNVTLLMAGPRPIDVNPLCISQSDFVYVFDLPNPRDRERVADNIGFPPAEFDRRVQALPEFGYLRWDRRAKQLVQFPPLPLPKPSRKARP